MASTAGRPAAWTRSSTYCSPWPNDSLMSITWSTASALCSAWWMCWTICRFSSWPGRCTPGVSKYTIWPAAVVWTPRIRVRVVWGLSEMMETFLPSTWFNRVDLPTLVRPTMATKPLLSAGGGGTGGGTDFLRGIRFPRAGLLDILA